MRRLASHPVILFGLGVLTGYMFSSQVARIPGVSSLPKK
jgi:hypothetical protein